MKISEIYAPMSIGEIYDKVTILIIKRDLIKDEEKLKNIEKECAALFPIFELVQEEGRRFDKEKEKELFDNLLAINKEIWEQVDSMAGFSKEWEKILNQCMTYNLARVEKASHLGIEVFNTNNKRAVIKKSIDEFYGCEITEEKSCT